MTAKRQSEDVSFKTSVYPIRNGVVHCSDRCEFLNKNAFNVKKLVMTAICNLYNDELKRDDHRRKSAFLRCAECRNTVPEDDTDWYEHE